MEKHWEISFISALSGLPAVKQQQAHSAFSPKPPVTRVRGLPVSTSDWMLWFVFVIRCEPGSQWQKWQLFAFNTFLLLHGSYKTLCLCLSRTTARHCRDAPKSFIYEHCDIEGSAAGLKKRKPQKTTATTTTQILRNSTPMVRRQLHLLPGNSSLLSILSGSIEINWERVSSSEA